MTMGEDGDEVHRSWNIIVEWTCNFQRSFYICNEHIFN